MKINVRLLLITFTIISVISVSSTLVYYSITSTLIKSQYSNVLLETTNKFHIEIGKKISSIDQEFNELYVNGFSLSNYNIAEVDFIYKLRGDSLQKIFSSEYEYTLKFNSIDIFLGSNPNALIKEFRNEQNDVFYYGFFVTPEYLTDLRKITNAQIALIVDGVPFIESNDLNKEKYFFHIISAYKDLRYKNNFDFKVTELDDVDFWATYFTVQKKDNIINPLGFLIYLTPNERIEFVSILKMLIAIILLTGLALSLILILLFTTKLRKQISSLVDAAELAASGKFDQKIPVVTKDEIGILAKTFNNMLEELKQKEKQEKEYSEFLELINKNPELEEISEVALEKIINTTGLNIGTLFIVEEDELRYVTSVGVAKQLEKPKREVDFYRDAINHQEQKEFFFEDNHPVIHTGLTDIRIKYLLIVPIIYNKEVISIIELASTSLPKNDIKNYIDSIHNELAVGLINAKALDQLEDLVNDLKSLNENYLKQNQQILDQNRELKNLHEQIKIKADELENQKTKAEELTKVKSQFLASMSHELRTPLNSILGLTELVINDTTTSSKTTERLSVVLRNGNKLLTLINNILEFSKLESGKILVQQKEFLLSDFIDELKTFISPLVDEKGLELLIKLPEDFDLVLKSDKNKIDQILTNILGNAVKFTNEGVVELSVYPINDEGIRFIIKDTGVGISDNDQDSIFEEFRQIDDGNNRKYGGTGLGLAICQRYIKLLNGSLLVESILGRGSTFTINIPGIVIKKVEIVRKKTEPAYISKEHDKIAIIANTHKETLKLLADYVEETGFKTIQATKSSAILKAAIKTRPGFITLSTQLDGKSGWETLIDIKANESLNNTKVFLTHFIENENLGYGFLVEDFFLTSDYKERFLSKINQIENTKRIIIRNVTLVTHGEEELQLPKLPEDYKITSYDFNNNKFESANNESSDLIIIQLGKNIYEELNLYYNIKVTKNFAHIPVVFLLPNRLSEQQIIHLNACSNDITRLSKQHNFDVLRVLRDQFNLKPSSSKVELDTYEDKSISTLIEKVDEISEDIIGTKQDNILIVDDDSDTLFTVGQLIEDLGFEPMFAKNGVECLLTLNNNRPDLILLDIMMPQMDGFETIKRIRDNKDNINLPVLALTAHAMLDDKNIIEKNGFDGLITKPVNKAELAFKIQKALKKIT